MLLRTKFKFPLRCSPRISRQKTCPCLFVYLFLPHFSNFCSQTNLFLHFVLFIPSLFLPYFWNVGFCRKFCLFLPYSCFICRFVFSEAYSAYSCALPVLFLAYSCIIFGVFLSAAYFAIPGLLPHFYFCLFTATKKMTRTTLCETDLQHFGSKQQTENSLNQRRLN